MQTLISHAKSFLKDDEGASMAEYVVLLAVIIIGVIAAITTLRTSFTNAMERSATEIDLAGASE